ncbi:MAG: hypothetical protein RSE41_09830 [Clostridia bacterium]
MDKNFVVEGIFDLENLEGENIINFTDVIKQVDIKKYMYENKIVNENKNINVNNNVFCIDILSICIRTTDFKISKLNSNNTIIYCVSFVYLIKLNISLDSLFKEITIKSIHSYSFQYSNIDSSQIEIYPVNIDVREMDYKLYININFVLIDKFKNMISSKNEFIYDNKNTFIYKESIKENKDKNYSYININQEFI